MDTAAFIENHPLLALCAVFVAVMGVGRLTRIITYEDYPPSVWFRMRWVKLTKGGGWSKLFTCIWCLPPWMMAFCLIWAYFSALHWTWWWFWTPLALAYLSSIIIRRDEPED